MIEYFKIYHNMWQDFLNREMVPARLAFECDSNVLQLIMTLNNHLRDYHEH